MLVNKEEVPSLTMVCFWSKGCNEEILVKIQLRWPWSMSIHLHISRKESDDNNDSSNDIIMQFIYIGFNLFVLYSI